jgi:alcohol dehydrogenase (cytochrome c)
MRNAKHVRVGSLAGLLLAAGVLLPTGLHTAAGASPSGGTGSWSDPNGNLANTRVATDSDISLSNVSKLRVAWTFKLSGKAAKSFQHYGSLVANPVVLNGVVYVQDIYSNVYALSLATGKLLWTYTLDKPVTSGPGPNGVAVVGGVVYGMSPLSAFALNATNGHVLWRNKHLLVKGQGVFGIQPQVANGRIYLASQYGNGSGGGILLALNATNGKVLWKFNTVAHQDAGVKSLGVGSGGAWETPLVGTDGSVTYGVGNPYQLLSSAIDHPEKQLYTNSEVNLDAATGKLRWYYQAVPNDFKDYDLQASPIATSVGSRSVILGSGKMGIVYEMAANNGALLWKTPVGEHNGHDNDSLNLLEHKGALKVPFSFLPGSFGGVLTNMAVAGNSVYVATIDLKLRFASVNQAVGSAPGKLKEGGEIEALNLATGKVEWDTNVTQLPLGAATVDNNLVWTTLINGELVALNRATGAIVYERKLPTTTNASIAIAGNTIIVPAGGLVASATKPGVAQIVAYRLVVKTPS